MPSSTGRGLPASLYFSECVVDCVVAASDADDTGIRVELLVLLNMVTQNLRREGALRQREAGRQTAGNKTPRA